MTTMPTVDKVPKPRHMSTRNVVETAIDASKADKSSTWESIAERFKAPAKDGIENACSKRK